MPIATKLVSSDTSTDLGSLACWRWLYISRRCRKIGRRFSLTKYGRLLSAGEVSVVCSFKMQCREEYTLIPQRRRYVCITESVQ